MFILGFKLKDFLRDDETLSHFLHHNASLPHHALKQIVEADVNLEKVEYHDYSPSEPKETTEQYCYVFKVVLWK